MCYKRTFIYAGHNMQPKIIHKPKILLLNYELELKRNTKIIFEISSSQQYLDFANTEYDLFEKDLIKIVNTGCNIILNTNVCKY